MDTLIIDYFIRLTPALYAGNFSDNTKKCIVVLNEKILQYCLGRFNSAEFHLAYRDIDSMAYVYNFSDIISARDFDELKQQVLNFTIQRKIETANLEEGGSEDNNTYYPIFLLDDSIASKIKEIQNGFTEYDEIG